MEDHGDIFHRGSNTSMEKILFIIHTILVCYTEAVIILFLIFDLLFPYSILYIALLVFTIPLFCEYILIPELKEKFE